MYVEYVSLNQYFQAVLLYTENEQQWVCSGLGGYQVSLLCGRKNFVTKWSIWYLVLYLNYLNHSPTSLHFTVIDY